MRARFEHLAETIRIGAPTVMVSAGLATLLLGGSLLELFSFSLLWFGLAVAVCLAVAIVDGAHHIALERDAMQAAENRRRAVDFNVAGALEPVGWRAQYNGVTYEFAFVLWLWVRNHGPTADFNAEITEVRGTPPHWA